MKQSTLDASEYIAINVLILILVIYFGYRSLVFMHVQNWGIVLFAGLLGIAIFLIGQVATFVMFKKHQKDQKNELFKRLNKK